MRIEQAPVGGAATAAAAYLQSFVWPTYNLSTGRAARLSMLGAAQSRQLPTMCLQLCTVDSVPAHWRGQDFMRVIAATLCSLALLARALSHHPSGDAACVQSRAHSPLPVAYMRAGAIDFPGLLTQTLLIQRDCDPASRHRGPNSETEQNKACSVQRVRESGPSSDFSPHTD
jgi:hypothetical protein